jgi:hypothetical protein
MVKFKSLLDFKRDYEKDGFIDKVCSRYYPLKKINAKQIQRYYLQYVKKWDKAYGGNILNDAKETSKILQEQSDDSRLSALVRERDCGCRLLKVLTPEEILEWNINHNGIGCILDAAHVFGKGAYPWMRYIEKNVVTLNRFSHNCLDNGKSPINGNKINDDQRILWWQRIINNKSDWDYLTELLHNRKGN